MSLERIYSGQGATVEGVALSGVLSSNLPIDTTIESGPTVEEWSRNPSIVAQGAQLSVTTTEVQAAIGAVLTGGRLCKEIAAGVQMVCAKHRLGGGLETSGHIGFALNSGLLVLRSIRAAHGEDASVELLAVGTSADGVNAPLTVTVGASLPTGGTHKRWGLNTPTVAGVTCAGCASWELVLASGVNAVRTDGDVWAQVVEVELPMRYTLTMKGQNPTWFQTGNLVLPGKVGTASLPLRERAPGGTFEDGSTYTIALDGFAVPENLAGGRPFAGGVQFELIFDGASAPISFS